MRSKNVSRIFLMSFSAVTFAAFAPAHAQSNYPSKPISFVVPYAAGGSSDTRSRQLAQQLSAKLNVPVVVENKPGASGNIGTGFIARATPDGYTIGLGNFAPLAVNKALYGKSLGFDPEKDIAPIALIERGALVLGVNAKSPYSDFASLLDAAKADPQKLNYASTGAGGASHLVSELLKVNSGLSATHVPYRGGAPAANDLLGGSVDFYLELASLFMPHTSGDQPRLKLLAVSAEQRLKALPDVPTFEELGVKDMVASNWFGVIAPAGTPQDNLDVLNQHINEALKDPTYRRIVESQGAEVAGGTPQAFATFIDDESARWKELIRAQDITIQ